MDLELSTRASTNTSCLYRRWFCQADTCIPTVKGWPVL